MGDNLSEQETAEFDNRVKVAVYRVTADSGSIPSIEVVAEKIGAPTEAVKQAYARLRASRLLCWRTMELLSGWRRLSRECLPSIESAWMVSITC